MLGQLSFKLRPDPCLKLRTDNDNLFHRIKFIDSEDRRCQLWLWERHYNYQRPHQGINGKKPITRFLELFPLHAKLCMSMF